MPVGTKFIHYNKRVWDIILSPDSFVIWHWMTELKMCLYQVFSTLVILNKAGLQNLFIQIRFCSSHFI
jgi:hypothetical protein